MIGAVVCVPLALGACSLTRPPAQATARVPAQFNAPLPPGTATSATSAALPHGGSVPALADWFRQLEDPVLVEIIQSAEAASPNLASAAARVAEARSTRIQAGAALLPSLDGSLSASRGNSSSFGASGASATGSPVGSAASGGAAGAAPATGSAGGGLGGTAPLTTLSAGLQSRWEIDLFGRLRADRDAASQREIGADAKWHEARVAIAAEAANAYFAERACRQQLDVAESDTRSRSETARLTGLSARAGFTAPADAALARAGASDSSARLTQQRATCAVQRKALVQLTGIDELALEQKLAAAAPVQRALPAIHSIASVPAQMLAQRPDVFAAEQAVAAASADVGSAEAERYPKLTLSGNISRLQIRASGFRESFNSWNIGPLTLSVPLLDGGARVANVDAAKARYAESASLYRANVRQAVREVEEALVNLDATAARTGDADSAVQGYQASFNATQARYDSGLASLFELEDSRRTLFAAQTARVSLQRERTEAWVALYRAMGGGWVRPDSTSFVAKTTATPSP